MTPDPLPLSATHALDEAGRCLNWYAGYNAAMRDYDKRQSVIAERGRHAALATAAESVVAWIDDPTPHNRPTAMRSLRERIERVRAALREDTDE